MKKLITLVFITILFVAVALRGVALESQYKNNLLNVEMTQMPDNRVSVLLVFEKPYTDAIKVVYKTDNEYNILLPETYHSMTSVSAINALNVRSANVKLVPYFNQDNPNGYTKITIKTTRPVVFNAHSSYITTKLAHNDTLIEKLNKEEEFKIVPTTLPVASSKTAKPATAKATPKKATTAKATAKKPVAKAKATPVKQQPKQQPKPQAKPVVEQKTAETPTPQLQPTAPATQTNTPVDAANTTTATQNTQDIPPAIIGDIPSTQPQNVKTPEQTRVEKTSLLDTILGYANSKYGFATLTGLSVLILLGLLLRLFGKTAKNIAKQPTVSAYTPQAAEEVSIPEDLQNIENLSWQEKYKAMKEHEEQTQNAQKAAYKEEQAQDLQSIYTHDASANSVPYSQPEPEYFQEPELQIPTDNDTDFDLHPDDIQSVQPTYQEVYEEAHMPNEEQQTFENEYEEKSQQLEPSYTLENLDDLSDVSPEIEGLVSPENLYEPESLDINISEPNPPTQPVLLNQTRISKTKGFYLIRYETEVALVGYIKDKIFLLQTFTDSETPVVQTRLTEKKRGEDIYLVRADSYKALVGVSKDEMKTLIKL